MSIIRDIASHYKRGTTANRPSSPSVGDFYYDTTIDTTIQYTAGGWVAVDNQYPRKVTSVSLSQSGGDLLVAFVPASAGPVATSYTATSGAISVTGSSSPITIPSTSLTDGTSYSFTVSATNSVGSLGASSSSNSVSYALPTFTGGNQSAADLRTFSSSLAGYKAASPSAGGTLTLNSVSLGSYDYTIKRGNQTISSFTNSDWFTTTEDTRSAIITVVGNLTINSGQTFIPSNRKLFTCIYVTGNLTVNGSISMTARGANHSGTGNSGGSTTAGDILLATGTYSAVVNPKVPAAGGALGTGGALRTASTGSDVGANGSAGSAGGTGGGGGGGGILAGITGSPGSKGGNGSAGTSFTGGCGGGACMKYYGTSPGFGGDAVANGGKGGNAAPEDIYGNGSGVGNPAGDIKSGEVYQSPSGTAGVLIIYVAGTLSGTGTITSTGQNMFTYGQQVNGTPVYMQSQGGSGGGGSVTIFYGTDSSSITPSAAGGIQNQVGGAGGTGTARKLALA